MSTPSARRNPDRLIVLALLAAAALFGGVVFFKSVLLKRPQGDFGCFARAAWAVRQGGGPLYFVMDDNGWHYNYPPMFAICMTPFADPPRRDTALTTATVVGLSASASPYAPLLAAGVVPANVAPFVEGGGHYLPYPASIVLFYALNIGLLFVAMRMLGSAVESLMPPPDGEADARRRWWALRLLPVFTCVVPIGLTLVRGQVQVLLLLFVSGFIVGLVRGKRFSAGLWLSAAIVMKLFPAFLLIAPLVRRDLRCLAGCAVGLLVGLVAVPAAVLGPARAVAVYEDYAKVLLGPALGLSRDPLREKELTDAGSTQSQSFQVILHKTLYLGKPDRPRRPAGWVTLVHLLICGTMTVALVWGKDGLGRASGQALFARLALLALLTVMASPVCHLHYFIVAIPLFAIVRGRMETEGGWRGYRLWAILGLLFIAAQSVPMIPGLLILRDVGVPLASAVACWVVGLAYFRRGPAAGRPVEQWGRTMRGGALRDLRAQGVSSSEG
jgi:hypothetical protein